MDMDIEDPSDWPAEFVHLRETDQLLRCPICKEYFDTAMATANCGHTFCSLCVRRCLSQKTECPMCHGPLTESDLHPNRLIDSIVKSFKQGRRLLLERLAHDVQPAVAVQNNHRKRPRIQTRSSTRATEALMPTPQTVSDGTATIDMSSDIELPAAADDGEYLESSPPSAQAIDNDGGDYEYDSDFAQSSRRTKPGMVSCPNCGSTVRESTINSHLNRCLAGKPTQTSSKNFLRSTRSTSNSFLGAGRLPKPTKLAYSLLTEPKLRKILRELGIRATGDKHQMQARHSEWVSIYMANHDSEAPVSDRQMLKRLDAWESAASKPDSAKALSSQKDVSEHAAKYADTFAALIAQAGTTRKPAVVSIPESPPSSQP